MEDSLAEILVVDDDRAVRDGLRAMLAGEGFAVRTARDGEEALAKISERRPGLVLLDVMMPKANGFSVCREIRKSDRLLPVVFLTAKDGDADQVRGFGLGADDYISKDAPESLLVARVRRAIERSGEMSARGGGAERGAVSGRKAATLRVGDATVDLATLEVKVGKRVVSCLTKTEADILRTLCSRRGSGFAKDELIASLRGEGFACEDSMLYVHVSNLRRKLGPAGGLVSTTHGVGYSIK